METPSSLSLSLALFFSVRRHSSLFKGKFRSGWFSQAVLDKAQGGACSIRGTVAESGTRLVACLYSLQLYKKDVKTEGNRGRDYNLTRDRQDLSLSLFLARRLTIKLHRSPCSLSCRQRVPSCETSTDLSVSRRGFWEGKKRKRKEEGGEIRGVDSEIWRNGWRRIGLNGSKGEWLCPKFGYLISHWTRVA